MRLYTKLGRRPAALRQYQQCVGVLRRELGVEPEGETRDLYHDLLRWHPATGSGAHSVGVTDSLAIGDSLIASLTDIPLIGRGHEMACLRGVLAKARRTGQVVFVLGEAGVGKTRLIGELAMEALHSGWGRVLLGRAYECEQVLPFGPWVNAFRAGHVGDEAASRGPRVPWQVDLAGLLPELGSRRGGAPTRPPDHLRVFEGIAQLAGHLAARGPVLLMLEDLHWSDEMSLRLLGFLARRVKIWPVLVIATARDDEVTDAPMLTSTLDSLESEAHVTKLLLRPLSQTDTGALVRILAGSAGERADMPGLTQQIWHTSEGRPFVVVEAIRASSICPCRCAQLCCPCQNGSAKSSPGGSTSSTGGAGNSSQSPASSAVSSNSPSSNAPQALKSTRPPRPSRNWFDDTYCRRWKIASTSPMTGSGSRPTTNSFHLVARYVIARPPRPWRSFMQAISTRMWWR
jgi:hypothetical protein